MSISSRVVLDIDTAVLRGNFQRIAQAVAPAGVIAVLKADAYGLGVSNVVQGLAGCPIQAIATAEIREALAVQAAYGDSPCPPILILGGLMPDEIEPAVEAGLRIPVPDLDSAKLVEAAAAKAECVVQVLVPLDTGMGRVGFRADDPDTPARIASLATFPHLHVEGMYSHFPMAYKYASDFTLHQIDLYKKVAAEVEARGVPIPWKHIANSDAINNFPVAAAAPFTHVRTGINLYGSFDLDGKRALQLRSVVTMRTHLAQVRTLPAGSTIGYGATYVTPTPMRIGTVAAGYADGLPLALSNRGHVLIRGRACPVLGRVCMDYVSVSLEQVPDAAYGDEVVLLGGGGAGAISVEDWATFKGTHPYEVLCSIGSRVERRIR